MSLVISNLLFIIWFGTNKFYNWVRLSELLDLDNSGAVLSSKLV